MQVMFSDQNLAFVTSLLLHPSADIFQHKLLQMNLNDKRKVNKYTITITIKGKEDKRKEQSYNRS